jgi:hypothetical protein
MTAGGRAQEAGAVMALPLALSREQALRLLGYPEAREPPPATSRRLDAVLAEARGLADGRGAWRALHVSRALDLGLEPIEAGGLVVGVATAGPALEARAAACIAAADPLGALLFDAIGSAAAEEAADRLSATVMAGASATEKPAAAEVSCRISPGYGRWALSSQRALLALLPDVGVRLTPSLMLVPRKSTSFALWLDARVPPRAGLSGCAVCGLETCRYRRSTR